MLETSMWMVNEDRRWGVEASGLNIDLQGAKHSCLKHLKWMVNADREWSVEPSGLNTELQGAKRSCLKYLCGW